MISVIGAGAFGTALAICLAREGRDTTLVARDPALLDAKENVARLPGHAFPQNLTISAVIPTAQAHLLVVPAQQTRSWLEVNRLPDASPLVLCAKGLERGSLKRQSEIAAELLPGHPLAVLTGPGFAGEIAAGLPTALTLAGPSQLQELLSTQTLRLYRTDDRIGAELGGALKNVVALACGIADGAGLGESAKAAVLTRGLAEMQRLGVALGAEAETFAGLSGLGDLTLTAGSTQSRNFRAGRALGAGAKPDTNTTIEGIATAYAASDLARANDVELPLADTVVSVLDGQQSVASAIKTLLARPLTREG